MRKEVSLPDEFASTMQQLVAEAEKNTFPDFRDESGDGSSGEMRGEFSTLNQRITELEKTMVARLEKLAAALPPKDNAITGQLARVDENLQALRDTESVNQQLFNSLHEELKEYRDNFLRDSLQKPFIRDLIVLFDDLTGLAAQMESAGGAGGARQATVGQWCANLENGIHSVLEILHRMEVNEIEPKDLVDRACHRVVSYEPADFAEDDGRIVLRVKRGFLWRDQVLRPEEVVAKRFN